MCVRVAVGEAEARHAHGLYDTAALELLHCLLVVEACGRLLVVRVDAPHKVCA